MDHFSTSTNYDDLNAQFQAIFGNDVDFESVVSDTDSDFDIDTYDALIQKVIALEMQRLIESGNADGISILIQTDLFDLPYDFSQHITIALTPYQQAYLNDFLAANVGTPDVLMGEHVFTIADLESSGVFDGIDIENDIIKVLKNQDVIIYESNYDVYWMGETSFGLSAEQVNSIWDKLQEYGFITDIGMIDIDAMNDEAQWALFKTWFNGQGFSDILLDDLKSLIRDRAYVFSTNVGQTSNDPLENALLQFETISEELLVGLTAPSTPIYANPDINSHYTMVSPFVTGGYEQGASDNSLFIRINHQKLQETMSRFFALQNTISAFMTIVFSISDMVSSISAKLGEDNSTASSTSKQRQKIIQSFNSYSSGINETVNTLTDIFEKTVEKTNESRYQTGLSQLEYEYSDVLSQLSNEFFSNSSDIQKEQLKADLSQDYYEMLYDNRQSIQQAMLDAPQFGPNLMPSQFSHLFLNDNDAFGDVTSMQVWAALFSNGIIDRFGHLSSGVDLNAIDLSVIDYAKVEEAFDSFDSVSRMMRLNE